MNSKVFSEDALFEMELLSMYELTNLQQGLKLHHEANPSLIQAAARLFEKDLITQVDGGYLTSSGQVLAEHLQTLKSALSE